MKISDIINESMGVGGVAVVAKPIGGMIKRNMTKKKKKKATEDSPNRQMAIYNPDGKTYKGKPMPNMDDGDPNNQGQEYGNFDDDEFAYDHDHDREIDNSKRDKKIASLLKTLNPQEQEVLKLRFEDDMSYEQVGEMFGVSRERIRQIEARALRKLRHPERSDQLRPHVGEGNKAQKGIPANATDAELKSARKAGGEKGQRAHWLLNMRKGNRKKK